MIVSGIDTQTLRQPAVSKSWLHLPAELEPLRDVFNSPDLRRVMPGLALSTLMINLLALGLPLRWMESFR